MISRKGETSANSGLNTDFVVAYNTMVWRYGPKMSSINGFSPSKLSYTGFLDSFENADTVADASVDASANVAHKDVVTLMSEMPKPHQKILAFNKLYIELEKKYGRETADKWFELEWTKALGMHDAHSCTFIPYCFAYDLKELAEQGLFFIDGFNYQPPRHLVTFVDFVKEHCSYAANHSAGAVAYPNLIPYMYYFWRKDVEEGYLGINEESSVKFAKQNIQRLIFALNQPFLRGSIQSAFTNVNFFDHPYFEAIFGGAEFPDGTFMIDNEEEIIEFQKMFLEEMGDIRSSNMMTFPVSTISLLTTEDGEFVDEEFAKWACEHNRKWNDSNWFVDSSVTSLSSCCRLRNDIGELGYFSSIGGTALKVGSVKVSTVNLARPAYISKTEDEYIENLHELLDIDMKVLDVQRHVIQRNIEKGLLHSFDCGMIGMEYLYSSIGIMGIFETMKKFGYTYEDEFGNTFYKDEAFEFGKKIFEEIHRSKDEFLKEKDYHINLEAVPGESMAVRFQEADEILFPDLVVDDLPMYGNQWIPLGIKTTLEERVKIASAFSEYCSGG